MISTSTKLACVSFITLALGPAAASADPTVELSALDRASGTTAAGADLAFVIATADGVDGFATRLDLHGEWVHPSGFGAYGAFGVSRAFLSADDPASDALADAISDETGLTNLELGGQYARALRPDLDLVAHAGIALPTGSDDLGWYTSALAQSYRLTDYVLALPAATVLRFGVSPVFHRGAMFARADVGVDIPLDQSDAIDLPELDPLIHANVAIGARTGRLSGALEVVNAATTGDADDLGDRFVHTATVSVRYDLGQYAPAIAVTTPLDAQRGDLIAVSGSFAARF
jgi:hypothetical protein